MEVVKVSEVDSTQDLARALTALYPEDGALLVIAESQLRGRGRMGRRWLSPRGGLWMTLSVRELPLRELLPLWVGVRLAEYISSVSGIRVGLAFPNDLLVEVDDALMKLGGVLIESFRARAPRGGEYKRLLIGVGLNVNLSSEALMAVRELNPFAVSLFALTGKTYDLYEMAVGIAQRLMNVQITPDEVLSRYSELDLLIFREVRVSMRDSSVLQAVYSGLELREGKLNVMLDGLSVTAEDILRVAWETAKGRVLSGG